MRHKSAIAGRLLGLFTLLLAVNASAADLWFYEWMDPPNGVQTITGERENGNIDTVGDRHWALTEFSGVPYSAQLRALQSVKVERISVLFKQAAAPTLAEDYVALARAWKAAGVEGQFKFIGTFPTAQEASVLRPVCDLGVKIYFVTNFLPGNEEAANLNTLKDCARVDFVLNRYFKYDEVSVLKKIKGIPISLTADYFPAWTHVDNLNLIGTPVDLRVTRALPTIDQIKLLNKLTPLRTLILDFDMYPMPEQYEQLGTLDRTGDRKLNVRWGYGTPRELDVTAWQKLGVSRAQVPADALGAAGLETKLRGLSGEVIVETFPIF